MSYLDSVKRGFKSFTLKQDAMAALADDAAATGHGFLTLMLTSLFVGILMVVASTIVVTLFGQAIAEDLEMLTGIAGIIYALMSPFIVIVIFFISYSIVHIFAKLLGGVASGTQFFRTTANTMSVYFLLAPIIVIPFIGYFIDRLISLWFIVVLVVITKTVHKLSTGRAVMAVVVLPLIVFVVLLLLLIGVMAYFGVLSPERLVPPIAP